MTPDAQKLADSPLPDSARRWAAPSQDRAGMAALGENRIRNVLSVIRSFVRRTAEGSITVEEYVMHLEARIGAYTRLLSLLGERTHNLSLGFLIADTLNAFGVREDGHFTLGGPEVALHGKTAESLGLALNELTLNALEHGALSHGGSLHISWTAEQSLIIRWQEDLTSAPSFIRSGLGLKFLHGALPFDLGAKVEREYAQEGLIWRIEVPQGAQWTTIADQ
jgi:two-component system CheB/CheR fusion protein